MLMRIRYTYTLEYPDLIKTDKLTKMCGDRYTKEKKAENCL